MPIAPLRAQIALPATADISGILKALGVAADAAHYEDGTLHVQGISQSQLEAATQGMDDGSHGARVLKKQEAQRELARRIAAGMPWQGRVLQIDPESQGNIASSALAASVGPLPSGFAWRMTDNSFLPLDNAGMLAMAQAAMGYVYALRARYWQIVDAAMAAPDAEAVEGIDAAAAWPSPPAPPSPPPPPAPPAPPPPPPAPTPTPEPPPG